MNVAAECRNHNWTLLTVTNRGSFVRKASYYHKERSALIWADKDNPNGEEINNISLNDLIERIRK